MHHLARLAGFDDQSHLRASLVAHQMVVHGGQRQQAGDRGVIFVDAAVGENQHRVAGCDRQAGPLAKPVQRPLQSLLAIRHPEQHWQRGGQKIAPGYTPQLLQIAIGQDGVQQLHGVAVLGRLIEDVALGADVAGERHDELFADRIDGRVGHLREKLLEVVEQRLGLVGEACQRRVGSHGADRFLGVHRHRRHQDFQVLIGIAESALAAEYGVVVGSVDALGLGQLVQVDLVLLDPARVRLARVQLLLDLLVGDDAALLDIHQEHAAGLEPAQGFDVLRLDRQHTRFRSEDRHVIVRDHVTGRAQSVAVERGPDHAAICEGDGGGSVPRLH